MKMISTLEEPKISEFKMGIDLNESAFQSKWRLMSVYRSLASEHKVKKSTVNKTLAAIETASTVNKIVKLIDKDFGDYVVFYHGVGDVDPADEERFRAAPVKVKKTRKSKKNSMESLEENMVNATKE